MTGLPHIYICPAEWPEQGYPAEWSEQGVSEGLVRSKNDQQSVIREWEPTFQLTTISSNNRHAATATGKVEYMTLGESTRF